MFIVWLVAVVGQIWIGKLLWEIGCEKAEEKSGAGILQKVFGMFLMIQAVLCILVTMLIL